MAHPIALWKVEDVSFDIVYGETDDPVVTVRVFTPAGMLRFMAEPFMQGATMLLKGLHVQDLGPHAVGPGNLAVICPSKDGSRWTCH
jgi:hypothetical protein